MIKRVDRNKVRRGKHHSVRKKVQGTAERPRLAVYRSINHIYAQIINDELGVTLCAASSLEPEFKQTELYGGNTEGAKKVGEMIAKRALDKGLDKVVYDRGGYLYHGRIAVLADSAREAGLEF
ncbi:LSU ribosomal protein L18P [Syntrophobotulus glycolicus DSM 8271]|uniref:Large ribosomal subunit protein uL18 n=1 Tax=Syntrophobotulus glycolicus (strain DSM 8271 / FlGlyR) TaxID=645991 RepID=F0SY24_SYNGF|nr:50S ribosomal protein L18 [Syntrophobotulus glycolicus]ADY54774.1 LSU ribosomal protein L18P [Syntrophobotulus glycolicus DSM 8271]